MSEIWQIYDYSTKDLKQLLELGFKVYKWRNCDRTTIEGSSKKLTFYLLKANCRVVSRPLLRHDTVLAEEYQAGALKEVKRKPTYKLRYPIRSLVEY